MRFNKAVILFAIFIFLHSGSLAFALYDIDDVDPVDITPGLLNVYAQDIFIDGNYLFTSSYSGASCAFDISDPDNPVWVKNIIEKSGRIFFIDNGFAYASLLREGLCKIDISRPGDASIVENIGLKLRPKAVFVLGDLLYAIKNDQDKKVELVIADIKTPGNSQIISTIDIPIKSHNIKVVDGLAYIGVSDFGLQIVDVRNPNSPKLVKLVSTELKTHTSRRGMNPNVEISNGYAFVTMNEKKLHVLDIDPPEEAIKKFEVELPEKASSIKLNDKYAYLSSGSEHGLLIINIESPSDCFVESSVDLPSSGKVAISGNRAYTANGNFGISIVNIENPKFSFVSGKIDSLAGADMLFVSGDYAYVLCGARGLKVVKINPIQSAKIVGSLDLPNGSKAITVSNQYLYIANGNYGLHIIDVSNPRNPKIVKVLDQVKESGNINIIGDYAYIALRNGLKIVDINPPLLSFVVKTVKTKYTVQPFILGSEAYTVGDNIEIIDISNPLKARITSGISLDEEKDQVELTSGCTFIKFNSRTNRLILDMKPDTPTHLTSHGLSTYYVLDNLAFAAGRSNLYIIPSDNLFEETQINNENTITLGEYHGSMTDAFFNDGYIYTTNWTDGFRIYKLFN